MIKQYVKGESITLSDNFVSTEFDCKCKRDDCKTTLISEDLVSGLQKMRDRVGIAVHIDSGFRCQGHQDDLKKQGMETARGISTHTLGMAADIWVSGKNGRVLGGIAKAVGFTSMGIAASWIHVDTRKDERLWFYRSQKNAQDIVH